MCIFLLARESGVTGLSAACLSTKRCKPKLEGVSWGQTSSARLSGLFSALSVTQCDARDFHATGTRLCCIPAEASCRAFDFSFRNPEKKAHGRKGWNLKNAQLCFCSICAFKGTKIQTKYWIRLFIRLQTRKEGFPSRSACLTHLVVLIGRHGDERRLREDVRAEGRVFGAEAVVLIGLHDVDPRLVLVHGI